MGEKVDMCNTICNTPNNKKEFIFMTSFVSRQLKYILWCNLKPDG